MNRPILDQAKAPGLPFETGGAHMGRMSNREDSLLRNYLKIILKRKWLLPSAIASCFVIGLLVTLLMTPQYTAVATLEIKRENFAIVDVEGVEPESQGVDMEFYETQYGLLRAKSVAARIVRDLNLANDADFFTLFGDDTFAEELADGSGNRATADARLRRATDILLDNMEITPRPFSRLVEIAFVSPDPQFSARVVNAWAKNFIDATLARRFDATAYARNFLEERLGQLRERLEDSERSAVAYAVRQGLVSVPTTTNSAETGTTVSERPLVADDLTALNRSLAEATADRIRAESDLRAAQRAGGVKDDVGSALPTLRERRSTLAGEYANMLVRFEPQYPSAMALAAQIEDLDRSIAREESRLRSTERGELHEAYNSALQREQELSSRVNSLKGDLMSVRSRTIEYNIFQRDVDTNRQLYDGLLQRYKEIGIAGGVGVNNIAVVDPAEVPAGPSSPNLILNLALSLLIGLGLGILLALVFEQFDDKIESPDDVRDNLRVPVLGAVPKFGGSPLEELEDLKSETSEAYLSIKTALALTTEHGIPASLAVTSAGPAEGKSTTAIALSRSMARAGAKVLLIDGDMRKPSIHKKLELVNDGGLSNYLAGEDDWRSSVEDTRIAGLSVLKAGPLPPNAAELINSARFEALLRQVAQEFDHCIIDSPPVMGLADAPLLSHRVEGTVFVIQASATGAKSARIALDRLIDSRARILGVVLSKFDPKRASYGYGSGYSYEYKYGSKEPEAA